VAYAFSLPDLLAAIATDAPSRRSHDTVMRDLQRLLGEQQFDSPEALNAFMQAQVGKVPEHKPSDSPEDRALERVDRANVEVGRVRIRLAREAAALWPGCADAWLVQAEEMPDPVRRLALYRASVKAGEVAIGKQAFKDDVGHFWGVYKTRPYMRARFGLANELWHAGELDESLAHMLDLLRLNEGDNMGVRHFVVPRLIERGRDAEALQLLETFAGEAGAAPAYAHALLEFRRSGAGETANARLALAVRENIHLAKYLTGRAKPTGQVPDSFRMGSEEEAMVMLATQAPAWLATPGAIPWLGGNIRPPRGERRAERKKKAARRGR
jgi:hypothetical protein